MPHYQLLISFALGALKGGRNTYFYSMYLYLRQKANIVKSISGPRIKHVIP